MNRCRHNVEVSSICDRCDDEAAESPPFVPRMPSTPQEWQEAADCAEFNLLIDSARKYGLITGGPEINVARCLELKLKALAMGIRPKISL
jgi:hypothetical protein